MLNGKRRPANVYAEDGIESLSIAGDPVGDIQVSTPTAAGGVPDQSQPVASSGSAEPIFRVPHKEKQKQGINEPQMPQLRLL